MNYMWVMMKKWLTFFILFLAVVFAAFLIYLYSYRAEFASNALSQTIGSAALIEEVSLSTDRITLKKVSISNPHGYETENAFETKEIIIQISFLQQLKSFLGFTAHIEKISIPSALFTVEMLTENESNWSVLLQMLAQKYPFEKGAREYRVDDISINQMTVAYKGSKDIQLFTTDSPLEMKHLTTQSPVRLIELVDAVSRFSLLHLTLEHDLDSFGKSVRDLAPLRPHLPNK